MRRFASALALLAAIALAACGAAGLTPPEQTSSSSTRPEPPRDVAALDPPSCPPDAANCATAAGEIAYVERVDPDADGDAHFVLLSRDGITGPGVSVIDVAASLRPRPLPRRGDLLAAAGPVYPGSYGQHQIQATGIDVVRIPRG